MTIATWGLALTGLGTVLAIVHPTIGARWGGPKAEKQERWLRSRYYLGIALIILGTGMQIVSAAAAA
jgi:hypothetical protein